MTKDNQNPEDALEKKAEKTPQTPDKKANSYKELIEKKIASLEEMFQLDEISNENLLKLNIARNKLIELSKDTEEVCRKELEETIREIEKETMGISALSDKQKALRTEGAAFTKGPKGPTTPDEKTRKMEVTGGQTSTTKGEYEKSIRVENPKLAFEGLRKYYPPDKDHPKGTPKTYRIETQIPGGILIYYIGWRPSGKLNDPTSGHFYRLGQNPRDKASLPKKGSIVHEIDRDPESKDQKKITILEDQWEIVDEIMQKTSLKEIKETKSYEKIKQRVITELRKTEAKPDEVSRKKIQQKIKEVIKKEEIPEPEKVPEISEITPIKSLEPFKKFIEEAKKEVPKEKPAEIKEPPIGTLEMFFQKIAQYIEKWKAQKEKPLEIEISEKEKQEVATTTTTLEALCNDILEILGEPEKEFEKRINQNLKKGLSEEQILENETTMVDLLKFQKLSEQKILVKKTQTILLEFQAEHDVSSLEK